MKILSIKNLIDGLKNVIKRFPFEVLFTLVGTVTGIILIELAELHRNAESWCTRVILMANLGLLLSLATSLYTESQTTQKGKAILLKCLAALFAVGLILILDPFYEEADRIRFVLLSLSFHLLVAFAAFTDKGHVQGFWQFNKALFLRFLTGVLYSVVLFVGISAAIGAMNFLFAFKFEWDTFAILWVIIVGLFNTTFVLAGIPSQFTSLGQDAGYPKGLKIFTQYVLIPLATIYVLILLSYEIKILLQWNLPKGMVSNLILCYAVFGILSILLVYPIKDREENKWIKTYARSFYFLLVPLIVLLLLAVGARVFRYGITEWRYFLIVLAGWLLFITIYFLTSKKQNIKLIPVSLCILTLLTIYGPQSSFSVARYSQQRVLVNVFKKNNAFKNDKLQPVDSAKMSKKDGNRAVATLNYLVDHHDLKSLQPYFAQDLNRISDSLGKLQGKWNSGFYVERYELRQMKLEWAKKALHLNRFSGYDRYDDLDADTTISASRYWYFEVKNYAVVKLTGYDYEVNSLDSLPHAMDGLTFKNHNEDNARYTVTINNETLSFDVKGKISELLADKKKLETFENRKTSNQTYYLPNGTLDIYATSEHYQVLFKIASATFTTHPNGRINEINRVDASYLIKVKK